MIKYIFKTRRCGKTVDLIMMAANRTGYIVTKDKARASYIFHTAKDLDIEINFPMTFDEATDEYRRRKPGHMYGNKPFMDNNIFIDDAHEFFQYMFVGYKVKAASFDMEDIDLSINAKYQESGYKP